MKNYHEGMKVFNDLNKLPNNIRKGILLSVRQHASRAINIILSKHSDKYLSEYPAPDLERLKYYYSLMGAHHEVMKVLDALASGPAKRD